MLIDQGIKGEIQGMDDKYNIPKYPGRIITLTPSRLTINTPKDDACEDPEFLMHHNTVGKLTAKSISGRFQNSARPTVKDMQPKIWD